MKQRRLGKKQIADLCVILALLLLAGILYLALRTGREEGGVVVVRVDGKETERHSLAVSGEFPLKSDENGENSNILVIENGEAWLRDANCPDKLCVKQGKIRYNGQTITCLPHRLTVTVEGGESDGVDFVLG